MSKTIAMGFGVRIKRMLNAALNPFNVRVTSCASERAESARLEKLVSNGHFQKAIFPVLAQFNSCNPASIFQQLRNDQERFASLVDTGRPDSFPLENDYYTTPDAEALYSIVQLYRPARILEIGSGNSTHLFRLATCDAGLKTHITSIDPHPRRDIVDFSDSVITECVEDVRDLKPFEQLGSGDILFIDSSHEIKPGNDLLHLVFSVLPSLREGVLVHFHDIFLPYEYPREWIVDHRWNWTEQYLVQALLEGSGQFEVIWPGHYLQRTWPKFETHFKHWRNSTARSLWLRKHQAAPPDRA